MVRRLVEQQQVGLREQQRGKRDAHPPAARIAVERAVLRRLVEAQPDEDARRARRRGMRVDGVQALVDLADVVRGAVVAVQRQLLRQQRGTLGVGGEHRLERRRRARRGFLRDIADAAAARHLDAALVGFELLRDDLHQRRLARAVAADQPDARTRRQRRGRTVENGAPAEAHGDIGDRQHGRALSRLCGAAKVAVPGARTAVAGRAAPRDAACLAPCDTT